MINFVFSTINKTLETRLVFWNFLLNHWMLLLKLHTRISFHRTEVAKIASSIPDGQFGHNIRYYLLTNNQRITQMISISNSGNRFLLTIICEIWIIFSWQIKWKIYKRDDIVPLVFLCIYLSTLQVVFLRSEKYGKSSELKER